MSFQHETPDISAQSRAQAPAQAAAGETTKRWQKLSPAALRYWYVSAAVSTAIWAAALVVAAVILQQTLQIAWQWYIAIALIVIRLVVALLAPPLRFRFHRWCLDSDVIGSREGWYTVSQRIAPLSRVQTIDHQQGPLQRSFKVATLEITTASSAGNVTISAIDFALVEGIETSVRAAVRDHQDGT